MSGGTPSVKVVLRNPCNYKDQIDYTIKSHDHELSNDWINALKELLVTGNLIEKNFCFVGFPSTSRNLEFLCNQLNQSIATINSFFDDYQIEEFFTPQNVVAIDYAADGPNHALLNVLHNHFEVLQGTVWSLSDYYQKADYETKYAIRQLNNLCHEIETLVLSQRKAHIAPYWVRPSQITTFINAKRHNLKESHRQLFSVNGYDRVQGGVYMHWTQIGKTFFEVFRDEGAPKLTDTICQAITELKFYSGEFDVEWGNDVVYGGPHPWHNQEQDLFRKWLQENGQDYTNPMLSCGYLPLGQIDLNACFGTKDYQIIWNILSSHLDIYSIEVDGVSNTFDYCWTDSTYQQMQIDIMKPGYDFSSRR